MVALLRAGVTNPMATERVRQIFAEQLGAVVTRLVATAPVAGGLPPERRAGLVAGQVLGLALTRYILRLPPVVSMDRETLIAWVGPTIQRYVVGES